MTQRFSDESRALKEYVTLEAKYQELISKAKDDLAIINELTVIEAKKNTLVIEVLGKRIAIEFSMVFQDANTPLGQISAVLIKNGGSPLQSQVLLLSQWFDYLGNVKDTPAAKSSVLHIEQNNYLAVFVYMTIRSILISDEMMPNTKNG